MTKPLISIIMSCYNGEKFIARSVNSILKQTYQNWELIFWDNNSNDNSRRIISQFKDTRIKYFKSDVTTFLSISRENAIKKSRGEFIAFLDVDDAWLKKKLEYAIKYFDKNEDCSLYFSNYFINYSHKKKIKRIKNKFFQEKDLYNKVFKSYIENTGLFALLTVLIKKDILDKEKYYFDNNLHIAADFELVLRLAEKYKFVFDEHPSAMYYLHKSNETLNSLEQQTNELLYCYKKIRENKLLLDKLKNYFYDTINYNFSKICIQNKDYKNFIGKLFSIKNNILKLKLVAIFFLYLIGINKI